MEIYYSARGNYGLVNIVVPETVQLDEVTNTLDSISGMLNFPLDYEVYEDTNEICVFVEDYYEFLTLRKTLYDCCNLT